MPYDELQKRYLWLVYYQEKQWRNAHHAYNNLPKTFGLDDEVTINGKVNRLWIEATNHQFMAFISDTEGGAVWQINQEGLVRRLNNKTDE